MKRVLAIDDSKEFLELLRILIEEDGHELVSYSHDVRDMREIERIHPDLIILDLLMGNGQQGGWQMLQTLRKNPQMQSVPVIVCTAAERFVYEHEDMIKDENVKFVLKPFDIDDFLRDVHHAFA